MPAGLTDTRASLDHGAPRARTRRNSGRCLWILDRMVRAPYSRFWLASQTGTTLCASTSWNGTSSASVTCAGTPYDFQATATYTPDYNITSGLLSCFENVRGPPSRAAPHPRAPLAAQAQRRVVGDEQRGARVAHERRHRGGRVAAQQEERDVERRRARRQLLQPAQHEAELARPRVQVLRHLAGAQACVSPGPGREVARRWVAAAPRPARPAKGRKEVQKGCLWSSVRSIMQAAQRGGVSAAPG